MSTVKRKPSPTNQLPLVDLESLKATTDSNFENGYAFRYENGRRYASGELGHYWMPNDEPEVQRLNEQHWVFTQVRGGALHFAPLPDKAGLKILDIGCGSGIWCIEMAEDYSSALIVGMDSSPIQPKNKPANVEWITLDMESEWPFAEDYFDLIHLSLVHGCVADWSQMLSKIKKHLAPGGWIEHQELSLCRQYLLDENENPITMPDDLDKLQPFFRWGRLLEQAGQKRGRPIQLGPHLKSFQTDAGLQHVTERVFAHKFGTWPSDPLERSLGARTMTQAISGMEGFTTTLLTKVLGWDLEDVQSFIVDIKRDMLDDSLKKVMNIHVVFAQKPGSVADGSRRARPTREGGSASTGSRYLELGVGVLIGAVTASVVAAWFLRRK